MNLFNLTPERLRQMIPFGTKYSYYTNFAGKKKLRTFMVGDMITNAAQKAARCDIVDFCHVYEDGQHVGRASLITIAHYLYKDVANQTQ